MIYKSLNKDFYYEGSGSTLSYYLTCGNETIFNGRAYNPKGIKINIRKIVEDWLENTMPDFRDYDGVIVEHPDACRVFNLYTDEGELLESYMVFLSHDELELPVLSNRSINGHADPRQKLFFGLVSEEDEEIPVDPGGGGGEPGDYSEQYLTFDIISGGSIAWVNIDEPGQGSISYSKDNGNTWNTWSTDPAENIITVSRGEKVLLKGNSQYGFGDMQNRHFQGDVVLNVYGNISSMTGWNQGTCYRGTFVKLFYDPVSDEGLKIISAENLVIPYTRVDGSSFSGLFANCRLLAFPPKTLPATTLGVYCYKDMFAGCWSLRTAPELPATVMKEQCYSHMFADCRSLVYPPELPAETLAFACFIGMFEGCTNLTEAPDLPVEFLAERCYDAMFAGCSGLTSAPDLPAKTLFERCYDNMFKQSGVRYIKCFAQTLVNPGPINWYTAEWVSGVPANGEFIKNPAADFSWTTGVSGIPSGWTVSDIA